MPNFLTSKSSKCGRFVTAVYRYVLENSRTGTTLSMKPLALTQVVLSKKNPTQATYKVNTTVSFAGLRKIMLPTHRPCRTSASHETAVVHFVCHAFSPRGDRGTQVVATRERESRIFCMPHLLHASHGSFERSH